jgi:HK97 family phage major capsid protein
MNMLTKEFTDAVEAQFGKLNADVQEALRKAGTAESILHELEQKMDRRGSGGGNQTDTWGQQFVDSDGVKAMAEERSRPARFRMDVKTTITTSSTSAGPLTPGAYRDGVVSLPKRDLRVRDVLPVVQISTGAVEYPKQTVRTNSAAMAAEGATKPESAYGWEMETVTPKVIAHWVPASVQILSDAPQLRDTIDTELRYGLALKEDEQLLSGSGSGENLTGLIPNSTAYSAPITIPGDTMPDQIGLALLQVSLAGFVPSAIIMNDADWLRILLSKDAAGGYLIGDPQGTTQKVLFGIPVVTTTSMAVDKFLVGDFPRAATLYDRWSPRVEVSTEHADFFVKNLVAIRAEQRLALAIKNELALVYGDFGNVS